MSLLIVAGINAAIFHAGTFPQLAAWDRGQPKPRTARLHAVVSLLI